MKKCNSNFELFRHQELYYRNCPQPNLDHISSTIHSNQTSSCPQFPIPYKNPDLQGNQIKHFKSCPLLSSLKFLPCPRMILPPFTKFHLSHQLKPELLPQRFEKKIGSCCPQPGHCVPADLDLLGLSDADDVFIHAGVSAEEAACNA